MPRTESTREGERDDRPLAAYFEGLPREAADRGNLTPDEVADIIRRDRDAATH